MQQFRIEHDLLTRKRSRLRRIAVQTVMGYGKFRGIE